MDNLYDQKGVNHSGSYIHIPRKLFDGYVVVYCMSIIVTNNFHRKELLLLDSAGEPMLYLDGTVEEHLRTQLYQSLEIITAEYLAEGSQLGYRNSETCKGPFVAIHMEAAYARSGVSVSAQFISYHCSTVSSASSITGGGCACGHSPLLHGSRKW